MIAESPDSVSPRLTVIVADDNEPVRRYLADVLQIAGYEVLLAQDGLDALKLLCARPDVGALITDVEMPRMDGLALARHARQCRAEIGIIYVSGLDHADVVRSAVPGSTVLSKPCSPRDLHAAVRAIC